MTEAASSAKAHQIIADVLPPVIASVLSSAELEQLREKLHGVSGLPAHSCGETTGSVQPLFS
jgi:hypothetical protein